MSSNINDLPTEIFLDIFTYFPIRQLFKSRQVCVRWKNIIDEISRRRDDLWLEHCQKDFENVYRVARRQAKKELLWFHIYRSLALWSRLNHATELRIDLKSISALHKELKSVKILWDGIVAVHTRSSIDFYDNIETLQTSKRDCIKGEYTHYSENEETIVIQNDFLHLFVIRKISYYNPNFKSNTTFDDVKLYLLIDREVYYITCDDEVYIIKLEERNLTREFVEKSPEKVTAIGYSDRLNLLTFERNILSVENSKLVFKLNLDNHPEVLQVLKDYNFLETVYWDMLYNWHCFWGHTIPNGPLQDIVVVKVYGDMVFVGCKWGVLRIYHKPCVEGTFDFYKCEPVKEYNFMERSKTNNRPDLSVNCTIRQIDVMETENGHTILVCMPTKIAVLHFMHFNTPASTSLLLHDVQNIKTLQI